MTTPVILAAARLRATGLLPHHRDAGLAVAAQHRFFALPYAERAAGRAAGLADLEVQERRAYGRALTAARAARHADPAGAEALALRIEAWRAIAIARGSRMARQTWATLTVHMAEYEAAKDAPPSPRRRGPYLARGAA